MAEVGGRASVVFLGGDGKMYGFEPLKGGTKADHPPSALRRQWIYDFDPQAPKDDIHQYVLNRSDGPSNHYGMPVVVGNRVYLAGSGDVFWGKNRAWIQCVEVVVSEAGWAAVERWSSPLEQHTLCTPAVSEGLVFATDTAKNLHCFDADSGRSLWSHACRGAFWASTLVANGKVYVASRSGDFWVFRAAREKEVLFETRLPDKVSATVIAANCTLFLTTMSRLYALAE